NAKLVMRSAEFRDPDSAFRTLIGQECPRAVQLLNDRSAPSQNARLKRMMRLLPAFAWLNLLLGSCLMASGQDNWGSDEEFSGPFPSWRNLRRDYGAQGDGKADDTAALQRALDDLIKHERWCVLYIPSGKYRLTASVKTVRKAHTDCLGVAVIGEDPASTSLVWDGPEGGTMFQWDAWYSRISRLTFDGANRAAIALL